MFDDLEERRVYLAESLAQALRDPALLEGYRYYQLDALAALRDSLAIAKRDRAYMELPTSAGKTEIMLAMIIALQRNGRSGLKMVLVEPTKRLVRQTRDRLLDRFPDVPVGLYYGDEKRWIETSRLPLGIPSSS